MKDSKGREGVEDREGRKGVEDRERREKWRRGKAKKFVRNYQSAVKKKSNEDNKCIRHIMG